MSSPASSVDVPVSPTPKRKPNRRANTAERRATHNAVERQRRETLNGRFLDLAALLPNLATVRRPSKSAIVNSSIAVIHAHRRRITTSSRAIRSLKNESDALRRELNEWRARANLPRVDEPPRSDDFESLMLVEDDWENSAQEERRAYEMAAADSAEDEDAIFPADDFAPQRAPIVIQQQQQQHNLFDPAAPDADKVAAWNAQLYSALQQQQQWTPQAFSPSTQQQFAYHPQRVQMFGVEDDASSVGSSDHSTSPHTSYELAPSGFSVDTAFPRRPSITIPPPGWVPQQQVRTPASAIVGGGGGGGSFHPMAWMM